jgi:uncharacterized protein YndB with AHSA1/START domain
MRWFDTDMVNADPTPRVVSANREISADADRIFGLIADPAEQPRWDGNDNLRHADAGQRVHAVGDVFVMSLRRGGIRENTVVEFDEGRLIAWRPNVPGRQPQGHLWRWELEPTGAGRTRVTHTYDWTELTDRSRFPRARATTVDRLAASIDRLAVLAQQAAAMAAATDIPVAHTPPGGYGDEFPAPVLAGCTDPIVENAPDLRGLWQVTEVEVNGAADPGHSAIGHVQRIEQCADRLVVTAGGVIHDMRCDGTEANGVHDVAEFDKATPITVVASYVDGAHVLRPVGFNITVTRHREGPDMVWKYVGFTARLTRVG